MVPRSSSRGNPGAMHNIYVLNGITYEGGGNVIEAILAIITGIIVGVIFAYFYLEQRLK